MTRKLLLALLLRKRTTVGMKWIAEKLKEIERMLDSGD
jgi:hypothetical protein